MSSRPHKFHAVRTIDSAGFEHPSKLQAKVTSDYRTLAQIGQIRSVMTEVSIPLSLRKKDRIRIDLCVVHEILPDGRFIGEFVDAKGMDLAAGIQKRRRFEDAYGIPIEVIRK